MNTGDVGQQQQQSLESAGIRHEPIFIGGGGSHPGGSTTTTERRDSKKNERRKEWARVIPFPSRWTGLTFRSIAITYALIVRSASAAVDTSNTTSFGSEPHVAIPGEPETAADCSPLDVWRKPLDQLTEEVILQEAPRVSVYVYDDPALDFSDLIDCYLETHGKPPWQDERADMAQDMGEIWLHRAMLEHPWRVLEPDKAAVFYVPIYPVLSFKLLQGLDVKCGGLTHNQRMKRAVGYLDTKSVYFKRFGGGDHVIVCAWWNCRNVFTPWQRMLLRRTVLGINEQIANWAKWGCDGRLLTIPYTASSVITTPKLFGGFDPEDRNIPFFFVGNVRKRPERQNLQVGVCTI